MLSTRTIWSVKIEGFSGAGSCDSASTGDALGIVSPSVTMAISPAGISASLTGVSVPSLGVEVSEGACFVGWWMRVYMIC